MVAAVAPGRQFGRVVRVTVLPPVGAPIIINPILPTTAPVAPPQIHAMVTVSKSLTPEPQRATVVLVNLAKTTRDTIAGYTRRPDNVDAQGLTVDSRVFRGTKVMIEAGYRGLGPSTVFIGDLSTATSRHVGTEWLTTLECGDSEVALTQAECRRTFDVGASALEVLTYAIQVLGMRLSTAPIPSAIPSYILSRGFVAYGRARETIDAMLAGLAPDLGQLNAIARGIATLGAVFDAFSGTAPLTRPITWWADDGAVTFLERGRALPGEPLRVSAEGEPGAVRLLERPQRLGDGVVRVTMLLHTGVRIGVPIAIVSKELAGTYRVEAFDHAIDSRSGPCDTTATLRVLS